jgi:4-amino-4-deoxy-L-arabinose transferase-like glycosyltransferase
MPMAAFALGAFIVIAATPGDLSRARLIACGILLGACLLCKASAVLLVGPLVIILVVICVRQRGPAKGIVAAGGAAAVCLAIGASAYAYAYAKTGNPVFPLYNAVFKSPYYPVANFSNPLYEGHLSWLLPYRMTFFSSGYTEGYDGALGFQYLLLFPAGLAAAAVARHKTLLLAAAVSTTAALLVVVNTQYIRYLFPAMAIGMLVCAAVFVRMPGQTKTDRRVVAGLVVALVGLNLCFLPAGAFFWNGFPLRSVFSPEARRALVVAYAPQRMLNDIVNAEAGASARVAYLGFPAGAGLDGMALYANWYNPELSAAVFGASTSQEVIDAFADEGVGYVITDGLAPAAPLVSEALQAHATEITAVNGAVLYRLGGDEP